MIYEEIEVIVSDVEADIRNGVNVREESKALVEVWHDLKSARSSESNWKFHAETQTQRICEIEKRIEAEQMLRLSALQVLRNYDDELAKLKKKIGILSKTASVYDLALVAEVK